MDYHLNSIVFKAFWLPSELVEWHKAQSFCQALLHLSQHNVGMSKPQDLLDFLHQRERPLTTNATVVIMSDGPDHGPSKVLRLD
jgi:uncharacterized protein with von Willebrand factor type A (vWA) domain